MVYLATGDMFEVHKSSLIADYDKVTVTNLYQPIIGFSALALYLTLISEASNQKVTSISSHERLLLRMKMSSSEFLSARKALEGVGLLKTYLTNEGGIKFYRYELYAPKTPNQFFDDTLLFGTLVSFIGQADANRLKGIYKSDDVVSEGENISASFGEVYHSFNDDRDAITRIINAGEEVKGRKRAKIDTEFSYETFFKAISEASQLTEKAFSKEEMKEIERIATLYGASEEETAAIVLSHVVSNEQGKRFDLEAIDNDLRYQSKSLSFNNRAVKNKQNLNSGSTELAKKVNIMEKVPPKRYLSLLQNGTTPAMSDLKIIDSLSKNFRLTNSVINVVVDYVLNVNNNVLSRAYAEKIAASLAREGIETAVDAMEFLTRTTEKPTRNTHKTSLIQVEDVKEKENTKSEDEEYDAEEWNKMLKELGVED